MIITKLIEPWEHYIVENFFTKETLEEVESAFLDNSGFEMWTGYPFRKAKSLCKYAPNASKYIQDTIPIFVKVCEKELLHRNLPTNVLNYKVMYDMICIDDVGYSLPIHTDILQKCMTFVIYINGKGSCTSLCKNHGSEHINSFTSEEFRDGKNIINNDNNSDTIIPNSALVFVPRECVTYHLVETTQHQRKTVQFTIQLV